MWVTLLLGDSQPHASLTWTIAGAVRVREARHDEDQTENHCLWAHTVHVDIWLWSDLLSHCRHYYHVLLVVNILRKWHLYLPTPGTPGSNTRSPHVKKCHHWEQDYNLLVRNMALRYETVSMKIIIKDCQDFVRLLYLLCLYLCSNVMHRVPVKYRLSNITFTGEAKISYGWWW